MEIGVAAGSGAASTPGVSGPHMTHLFVALAGVEVHPELAGDDAPGWEPLFPQLPSHPVQVDLLADAQTNSATASFPDAVLPAGLYRQIRLRVASQLLAESAREANRCPSGAPHCAQLSDGQVWPLSFPSARSDVQIVFEGLPGGALYVPPDGTVALVLELDPNRSWVWRSGESMIFHPVFRASVQRGPDAN